VSNSRYASREVRARFTRNHIGAGVAPAANTRSASSPQSLRTRSRNHLGHASVGRDRRETIARGASQQRIHHAGLVRATEHARGFHRCIDGGMRGQLHFDLREPGVEQRAQRRIASAERTRRPRIQRGFEARALAQRGERDRFQQRAIARIGMPGRTCPSSAFSERPWCSTASSERATRTRSATPGAAFMPVAGRGGR
jgi:hypothetical protein